MEREVKKNMAINLVTQYEKQMVKEFTHESFIDGGVSNRYSWDGNNTIVLTTPVFQEPVDYDLSSNVIESSRFGQLTDLEDKIQRITFDQSKAFNKAIDLDYASDQQYKKKAGEMIKEQFMTKMVPLRDKNAFSKWASHAGIIVTVTSGDLAKTKIAETLSNALIAMDNALVPSENRTIYLAASNYGKLRLCPEFIEVDNLANTSLTKGTVGTFMAATVKKIPDIYLPAGVQFMICYKESVVAPVKIKTMRILKEHPDVDGAVLQGHHKYVSDVVAAIKDGVYVAVLAENRVADPTVSISAHSATVNVASGATAFYTLDGSDPRDADNPERKAYSTAVTTI